MAIELSSIFESFQGLQIIGIIIAGFLLGKTILDFSKKKIGKGGFYLWVTIWGVALIAFSLPGVTQNFFALLETGNTIMIALILSNVVLFILVYVLFEHMYKIDKKFKLFIQKLALSEKLNMEDKGFENNKEKRNDSE